MVGLLTRTLGSRAFGLDHAWRCLDMSRGSFADQRAVHPPSTGKATPVMLAAPGPERNTATAPNCFDRGEASRRLLFDQQFAFGLGDGDALVLARASIWALTKGVSTQPGQMALQVIGLSAFLSAHHFGKADDPVLGGT